jgi:hypothetical protein
MKTCMPLLLALIPLAGCGGSDFVARQADWNSRIGMGGMNTTPGMSDLGRSSASDDEATRQRIKMGEDVENADARRAGFGPSLTDGMKCATSSSFSGSANSGVSSSHTECH